MKLFIIGLFWSLGLLLGSAWQIKLPVLFPLLLLPAILFVLAFRHRKFIFYAFYLLALLLGIARLQLIEKAIDGDSLAPYYSSEQSIQGLLDSEVMGKGRVIRFELANIKIKIDNQWKEVNGRILVQTRRDHEYRYGDSLYLQGEIKPLSKAPEYYRYLEKQGITSWISFPRIKLLESGKASWFKQNMYNLRIKLSSSLSSSLPEPQGALAQALLFGVRQEIPRELERDFRNTGTTHLLAISGMNISVFAGMVMALGLWLFGRRRSLYIVFAFLLVWLYTFLAGMNPPVIRAAFMASVFYLAEYLGRPNSSAPALAFSGIVMTAMDPLSLRDISFQLSFMAMLGLAFIAPLFIKMGRNIFHTQPGVPDAKGFLPAVWDMASVSTGAILATLPLTAYYFNIIPLAGLPATILASLTLPHIIIVSTLTSLAGLLFSPVAQVFGWVDWLFLSSMILAVKAFSFWPYFTIAGGFPLKLIGLYYALLIAAIIYMMNKNKGDEMISDFLRRLNIFLRSPPALASGYKKALLLVLLLANLLIWTALLSLPDRFTHVYFLDTGHGDSIFIQTNNGHQILIDGGPEPYKARHYLGEKMPFWDRSLDIIALTHPHEDHLGGLPQVLLKYKADYILDPGLPAKSQAYEKWRGQVKVRGAKDIMARHGTVVDLGSNTSLEVLHPPQQLNSKAATDIDNNAMVFRLTVGQVRFLLPSDNRDKGQRETLLNHPDLWSTVIAAPHHGGESLDPLFVNSVNPSTVIVSNSFKDRLSQEKAISNLKQKFPQSSILTTADSGSIEYITDGEKLWVRTER